MSKIQVAVADVIDAAPEDIYAILVDFHEAHPAILPKQFKNVTIVEGGTGAGTVYDLEMEVLGTRSNYRMVVREPEPGRALQEADETGAVTTTITVDPVVGGRKSRVTIHSAFRACSGLTGLKERLFQPVIVRGIYKEELQLLAEYVQAEKSMEKAP